MRRGLLVVALAAAVTAQSRPADLATRLASADPAVRAAAVEAARGMAPAEIVRVGALLDDADALVATAASRALRACAGRTTGPGEERERAEAEAALLLLGAPAPGRSPRARAEAIHLLALVGTGEATVSRLVQWLADAPVVAEAAEFALARMPGAAVRDRLVPLVRPGLHDSAPGAAAAARLLASYATELPEPQLLELGEPGLDGLAAAGDPRAETRLRPTVSAPGTLARWLVYLHARAAADARGRETAQVEFLALLRSDDAHARRAALSGLITLSPEILDDVLFERLGDAEARVAALAVATLVERARVRPELLLRARGVLAEASPTARAGLLRVLHAADPERALAEVVRAAGADEPVARGAACELLGSSDAPAALAALRSAAQAAGTPAQDAALRSLLAIAARRARAGDRKLALELCHEVLGHAGSVPVRAAALAELRGLADESTLAQLQALSATPELREDVAQVQLAVARRMPGDKQAAAVAILRGAHEVASSASLRRQILTQMEKLGEDTSAYAARGGFVQEWQILGPCGPCDQRTLGEHPFGADGPALDQPFPSEGRQLRWQSHRTKDPCGVVDLTFLEPKQDVSAYALLDLPWPRDQAIQLKLGSDDGVAVWVNGERVHHNAAARGVEVDEDAVACRLRQGPNRILLKVAQGGGGWGFCVRLADEKGEPMDLTAVR